MTTFFKEQCVVEEGKDSSAEKAVVKPNKDVPSDPDAGYLGHKGQGYQAQIVENYTDNDKKQVSLLTNVAVESADQHDANALIPALEELEQRGLTPEKLLADSLDGSDSNCEQGRDKYNVEILSPAMPGNQKKINLAEFTFDNNTGCIVTDHEALPLIR